MAHELAEGAKSSIKSCGLNKSIDIEVYKESPDMASENGSGIMYLILHESLITVMKLRS